jgi:hypothetical protein
MPIDGAAVRESVGFGDFSRTAPINEILFDLLAFGMRADLAVLRMAPDIY